MNRQCRGHFGLWPAGIDPLTLVAVGRSNAEWRDYDWALADEALRQFRRARISELRRLATDILSRNLGVIEGSLRILDLRGDVDIDFSAAEYRALQDLVWATLHLPFGPVRQYWATDALREKDEEIRETEERWAEIVLRDGVLLIGGLLIPNRGPCEVLFHAQAILVHVPEVCLPRGIPVVRRPLIPSHGLCVILRHALAILIHPPEACLPGGIPLVGGLAEPN